MLALDTPAQRLVARESLIRPFRCGLLTYEVSRTHRNARLAEKSTHSRPPADAPYGRTIASDR